MDADRCYLSVLAWPPNFDESRRMDAIESVLHVERFKARELARRSTPAIFARCGSRHAGRAEEQLREWGVAATSIAGKDLARRLSPVLVKCLSRPDPETGLIDVTPRIGGSAALNPCHITGLVRGHVRQARASHHGDLGVHALHQLHGTLGAEAWDQGPTRRPGLHIIEVLDIHMGDGRHYRVIGDQCSFELLGPNRTEAVSRNMDLLAGVLAGLAPGVPVDRGFDHTRHLAEFVHDFVSGDAGTRGLGAFSVYSAWVGALALRAAQG